MDWVMGMWCFTCILVSCNVFLLFIKSCFGCNMHNCCELVQIHEWMKKWKKDLKTNWHIIDFFFERYGATSINFSFVLRHSSRVFWSECLYVWICICICMCWWNNRAYFMFYLVCDTRAYNLERHWNVNKFQCLSLRVYLWVYNCCVGKWQKHTFSLQSHYEYGALHDKHCHGKQKSENKWAHFHCGTHRFR